MQRQQQPDNDKQISSSAPQELLIQDYQNIGLVARNEAMGFVAVLRGTWDRGPLLENKVRKESPMLQLKAADETSTIPPYEFPSRASNARLRATPQR